MPHRSIAELEALVASFSPEDGSTALIDARLDLAWELGMTDPRRCRALSERALADALACGHTRGRAGGLRNLGYLSMFEGDLANATARIVEARTIFAALGDEAALVGCLDVLSNLHLRLGALDASLEYAERARELAERLGDARSLAWSHHNVAAILMRLGEDAEAEPHLHAAAIGFAASGNAVGEARIRSMLADILVRRGEHAAAEVLREQAAAEWLALGHLVGAGYARVVMAAACIDRGASDAARAHLAAAARCAGDIVDPDFHTRLAFQRARLAAHEGEVGLAEAALVELLSTQGSLKEAELELAALDLLARLREQQGDPGGALVWLRRRVARGEASRDEETRSRAKNLRMSMQLAAAEREAQVVEQLLLRTLPAPIVRELRSRGRVESAHHERATVLFADLVGFTRIAERLAPAALVAELDELFGAFDEIARRRGLEKLKTIGDAYMAAAGVPVPRASHAVDAVLAALDLREALRAAAGARARRGAPTWSIRIGLSSGPLVAGVIGRDKFAYDVWGDTVNTASRMESSGEPDRINVSRATYDLIAPFFVCTPRGAISAKNKGAIEMFFVERLAPAYAADPAGVSPSDALLAAMEDASRTGSQPWSVGQS